jgi:hypothetical protein
MNARSKKVLATTGAALMVVLLPTGCAFEAVPGLIGGGAAATVGGAVGGGAPAAGAAAEAASAAAK